MVLRHRLDATSLLGSQVTEGLLDFDLFELVKGAEHKRRWGAKALEGDGAVAKVHKTHETRVGVEMEGIGTNCAGQKV